jgi:hypothetical protein
MFRTNIQSHNRNVGPSSYPHTLLSIHFVFLFVIFHTLKFLRCQNFLVIFCFVLGALQVLRIIIQRGKILRQLWTGLMPTLFRDVPFSAIYWMMYEAVKSYVNKKQKERWKTLNSFLVPFISGATAGTITQSYNHIVIITIT